MSDTGSRRVDRLEVAWAGFVLLNLAAMTALPQWETLPFHFIWISLTLLYGVRVWGLRKTTIVLALVSLSTGALILRTEVIEHESLAEVSEVPLMAAVFVAMVWHARRRERAIAQVRAMADLQRRTLERERDFVRSASHELRTPVTVARGHAELLAMSLEDPQQVSDIDVVVGELDRLSTLTDRLLTLAAADSANFLSPRRIDVSALVAQCRERWRPVAQRSWELDIGAPLIVSADPDRLCVALDAIVENAVEHTGDGGRIVMSAHAAAHRAIIEIADDGSGMPSGLAAHVFEPFARSGGGRRPTRRGTGLGLSIVRAIVTAHGGTVAVASEPGVGTTITISLPSVAAGTVGTSSGAVPLAVAAAGDRRADESPAAGLSGVSGLPDLPATVRRRSARQVGGHVRGRLGRAALGHDRHRS